MVPLIDKESLAKKIRNMLDEDTLSNPFSDPDREITLDLENDEDLGIAQKALREARDELETSRNRAKSKSARKG